MNRDLQRMMKQAQKMAAEMQRVQAELAEQTFEASAGGGSVTATVTGDQRVVSVRIDPGVFDGAPDADDVEMLEDAVVAALNSALERARAAQQEAMGPLAGGGVPGLGV